MDLNSKFTASWSEKYIFLIVAVAWKLSKVAFDKYTWSISDPLRYVGSRTIIEYLSTEFQRDA